MNNRHQCRLCRHTLTAGDRTLGNCGQCGATLPSEPWQAQSDTDDIDVYAIPGEASIIDTIDPQTNLTRVYGRTAAEVAARYPGAVRRSWEDWRAKQIQKQQAPISWHLTTGTIYDRMLNILPPAAWIGGAFLVGEPIDHCHATGCPRFEAYWRTALSGRHYVASRPLTIAELRAEVSR